MLPRRSRSSNVSSTRATWDRAGVRTFCALCSSSSRCSPRKLSFSPSPPSSLALDELDLLPAHSWYQKLENHWIVTEDAAQDQLARTVNEVTHSYAYRRNIPSVEGTSSLSPYLAWGQISPRQVSQAVLQGESRDGRRGENKFLTEIGWREVSYHLLYNFGNLNSNSTFHLHFDLCLNFLR